MNWRSILAPGQLDRTPSPRWPDPWVFGHQPAPQPGETSWPNMACTGCGAQWAGTGDEPCWACGGAGVVSR